jgi:hypothetical protein
MRRCPAARDADLCASAVVIAACVAGCAPDRAGVVEIAIDDPASHWRDDGFVKMEPPIHLPSSALGRAQVEIWLRLPASGDITTVLGDDDVARLAFPAGTIVDRVEYAGEGEARRVVDVRGATIDDDERCRWHVLRPRRDSPGSALTGVQWACDDRPAQDAATATMLDVLREHVLPADMAAGRRDRELAGFAAKNDCGGCHVRARPDARTVGEHGTVHRGTDASGFFVPQTVLAEAAPLELYGAFDPNAADPGIEIDCGGAPPEPATTDPRPKCADDRVPIARLDWPRAREHEPARIERVCAARAALVGRLDAPSRAHFAAALRACAD